MEVTVGAAFTVKHPVHVALPASEFVTVTFRAPVVAPAVIVMFAVTCVAETNVVEFTVMPVPEKVAAAPLANPVPLTVTFWLDTPWPLDDGLVEVTVGAALTVKHPVQVAFPASGFVTVTSLALTVAPAVIVMFAVTCVAETNVVEFTVMPVPEKVAARPAPVTKPVPFTVMFWLDAPWPLDDGLVEVTVGAAFTVKQLEHVPTPASGLVTRTLPAPVVAVGEIVTFAVSWVADTKVVEFTVIPEAENEAAAPETKPVPLTVMFWFEALRPRDVGEVDVTVGFALTVKQFEHEPVPASPFVTVMLRNPVVAPVAIVMFAVNCVAETYVVEFTVMPVPEKAVARLPPLTNPVPVSVTS